MTPEDNSNPPAPDPAEIEKLLEIELMQKRAGWQQAKTQRTTWRALSFLFLFLIIIAALAGYFIFLSPERMNELKSENAHQTEPASPE
ncbi:MAG: hypothetical protein ABIR71_06965 [Chthoniobacterales bacterium]